MGAATKIDKVLRLDAANSFLRVIADLPTRRFFRSGDRVARLMIDRGGRIWYVNEWSGARRKRVYVSGPRRQWNGWVHGGTLAEVVQCLVQFVRTGERLPALIGTPWWGMTEGEIETMRIEGRRLGVVSEVTEAPK